jgi:UDP-3-O-acyl-N-acetylglucosamine deacetylase
MGNPAGIFNIGAFFATLNAELQNFVNKLKENPIIIPAKFDIESLARDLTEAWKRAKIDGLFSNVPRMNPPGVAFGGGTAGNSLVNNDNSTINVNVQRLPEEIARKLAIV